MVHRVSTKVSSPQTPRVSSMAKQEIRPRKHEGPREGDPRAFVLWRQQDEEKLRHPVKQEERGGVAGLRSLGPADKSYNRLTDSFAQGS